MLGDETLGWLGGWLYRKSHVLNPASGSGTLYQVRVTVHYGSGSDSGEHVYLNGKCRTDFADVRLARQDGVTLHDLWMESYVSGNYAIFWVEVIDDLSGSSVTAYIYYGKSDATSVSDGFNTFLFFDDWTRGNYSGWTVVSGTWSVVDGVLKTSSDTGKIKKGSTYVSARFRFRNKMVSAAQYHHTHTLFIGDGGVINCYDLAVLSNYYPNNSLNYKQSDQSGTVIIVTWARPDNTAWYIREITRNLVGLFRVYEDGVYKGSGTNTTVTTSTFVMFSSANASEKDWDWFFISKFVDPEPSHGDWGTEETLYHITGVTRDANGNPLGSCTVWLFRTSDKAYIGVTVSNGNGDYSFNSPDNTTEYFIRAYKDGVPNVFGTTDRNLVGE